MENVPAGGIRIFCYSRPPWFHLNSFSTFQMLSASLSHSASSPSDWLYLTFILLKYPPRETPVFSHTLIPVRFDYLLFCLLLSPFPISQNFSTGPFKVSLCPHILHLFSGQFLCLLLLILTWLFRGSCFPCGSLKWWLFSSTSPPTIKAGSREGFLVTHCHF